MMRITLILLSLWAAFLSSCGTNSHIDKYPCLEECAMLSLSAMNKCQITYASDDSERTVCADTAYSSKSTCDGRCYGNL